MKPTDQLDVIIPTLIEIVDRLDATQMNNPTACSDFTVRGVLDHMMGGAAAFVPAFLGQEETPLPQRDAGAPPSARVPAAEFRSAMTSLLDAVHSPGAMERTIDAPFGQVPGEVFARFVAFDGLIHGWDLTTATGQSYTPPADVVAAVDAFARATIGPQMRDGDTFAVETSAPHDAPALEALVAFSGRTL